jgi:large subunit ribosomal protein L20
MTRVKRGTKSTRKIKTFRLSKGYRGSSSKLWRFAKQRVRQALFNSYADRRIKKRLYRQLWIKRLNSVLSNSQLNYSELVHFLKLHDIKFNRKVLSQLAIFDRDAFEQIILQCSTSSI